MATTELENLASAVERHTAADDVYDSAVSALRLSRLSAPSTCVAVVYEPSLCIIAQGSKEVFLADQTHRYDPALSQFRTVFQPYSSLSWHARGS